MSTRLEGLPKRRLSCGLSVREAASFRSRLLGLALIGRAAMPHSEALWLRRTRSVHTFGMRFSLDLVWLGADGEVVRIDRSVPPGRLRSCRAARSVVELPVDGQQTGVVEFVCAGQ
jgi:uncharacterized membrane protein (UPF0127 family)